MAPCRRDRLSTFSEGTTLRAIAVLTAALSLPGLAPAAPAHSHAPHAAAAPGSTTAASTAAPLSEADVRKVDRKNGRITLRHGEIRSLDMPAMTMVFRVRDPALLDAVKAGDKVRFSAERSQGSLWVTAMEAAR
jgi:Cu(I)/Ag(I) efflux system protein CusF